MKHQATHKKILIIQGPNMNLLGYRFKETKITPDKLNACLRKAAKKFESFGCSVEEIDLKIEQWAWDSWWTTHNAHAYSNNGKLLESNPYQLTWYYKRCLKLTLIK